MAKSRYFVVSAFDPTMPVHQPAWECFQFAVKKLDARPILIPTNGRENYDGSDLYLDAEDLLIDKPVEICKNLLAMGDITLNNNTVTPLAGLVPDSNFSTLYGHQQIQYKVVPAAKNEHKRIMGSTGTISKPRYGSNSAIKAAQFHTYGCLIIRVTREGLFYKHQTEFIDGGFYYLNSYFNAKRGTVSVDRHYTRLVCGDVHYAQRDPKAWAASFSRGGMVEELKSDEVYLHDLVDFQAQNHHNTNDVFGNIERVKKGLHLVRKEYTDIKTWLTHFVPKGVNYYIVDSNHNQALDRWVNRFNPAHDPHNAPFYFELVNEMGREENIGKCLTELALNFTPYEKHIHFLSPNSSHTVGGYDLSQHGHVGANGTRGSSAHFASLRVKMITGHTHSPSRLRDHICVGHLAKSDLGYNNGFNNHMHCNAVIYPNGAASLIPILPDGSWR
jgi:hypothetical protein